MQYYLGPCDGKRLEKNFVLDVVNIMLKFKLKARPYKVLCESMIQKTQDEKE